MRIVEKISRTNYEAFVSLIAGSNMINSDWNITIGDNGNNHVRNNRTIQEILLTSDEVTIIRKFQMTNDSIVVCKSFDKFTISYHGGGKYLKEYEELIDRIVEESETITSTRLNTRSTFRHLSSSE